MDVRPLRPDEGLIYRNLRLRALSDAPDAFGQTLGEAESRSDEEWIQRAGEIAACPESEVLFIARDGKIPCGTVYLRLESGIAELYAMWVDPAFRRRHVGFALLEAANVLGKGPVRIPDRALGHGRERGGREPVSTRGFR